MREKEGEVEVITELPLIEQANGNDCLSLH